MRNLAGLMVLMCLTGSAFAQGEVESDRSELSRIDACQDRDPGDFSPFLMECESHAGYRVMIAASEHSARLAFGDNGHREQFEESPEIGGLYTTLGPVIEWRHREGEAEPFANIIRWRGILPEYDEDAGDFTGESSVVSNVLVVSALDNDGEASACHVAYIDAAEIPGANEVAHRVSARYVPGFRCGASEVMVLDLYSAESLGLLD